MRIPRKLSALAVMMVVLLLLLTGCARFSANDIAEIRYQNGVTSEVYTYPETQIQKALAKLNALSLDEPIRDLTERPAEGTYIYHFTLRDQKRKDLNHIWVLNFREIALDGKVYNPDFLRLNELITLFADEEYASRGFSSTEMFYDIPGVMP